MDVKRTKWNGFIRLAKRFASDERGLETVEYAIIAGIVVAGTVATIVAIGTWVSGALTTLQGELGGAPVG
ncbi:MAG: Flp family type IVb pilin [Planctomycetes bacterium]|nr:Flp family type IVb pilin [Planctomycetota bacterium]